MKKFIVGLVLVALVGLSYIFYLAQIPPQNSLATNDIILSGASETTSFGWWISDNFQLDTSSESLLQAKFSGPFGEHTAPLEILESLLEVEFGKITAMDLAFAFAPDLVHTNKTQQVIEALREIVFPRLTRSHARFVLQKTHKTQDGIVLEGELSINGITQTVFILTQITNKEEDTLSMKLSFTLDRREWNLNDFAGYFSNYITISGEILATR